MKNYFVLLALTGALMSVNAQIPTNSFPLWPSGAPGALGSNITNDVPTLTPFLPDPARATGAAMVVCAGGAYGHLADHEGKIYAQWLNDHGVTCFVLKYRLGSSGYRHPIMLQDGARAIRLVRSKAADWKLDPKRIGMIGSSAGGHLTSTVITHFDAGKPDAEDPVDRESSRPDFAVLCYPVITMGQFAHQVSKNNLLGTNASPELAQELSSELHVTTNTPTCFIWHTFEDKTVPLENTLLFADALRKAHVPFDLHVYQKGAHGMGLGARHWPPLETEHMHPWSADCIYWLKGHGIAN
jgi:acetyl esterase/lipase